MRIKPNNSRACGENGRLCSCEDAEPIDINFSATKHCFNCSSTSIEVPFDAVQDPLNSFPAAAATAYRFTIVDAQSDVREEIRYNSLTGNKSLHTINTNSHDVTVNKEFGLALAAVEGTYNTSLNRWEIGGLAPPAFVSTSTTSPSNSEIVNALTDRPDGVGVAAADTVAPVIDRPPDNNPNADPYFRVLIVWRSKFYGSGTKTNTVENVLSGTTGGGTATGPLDVVDDIDIISTSSATSGGPFMELLTTAASDPQRPNLQIVDKVRLGMFQPLNGDVPTLSNGTAGTPGDGEPTICWSHSDSSQNVGGTTCDNTTSLIFDYGSGFGGPQSSSYVDQQDCVVTSTGDPSRFERDEGTDSLSFSLTTFSSPHLRLPQYPSGGPNILGE